MKVTVEGSPNNYYLVFEDDRMRKMPAGPRLFRADPPSILFQHSTREEAQRDAAKLQAYLNEVYAKRQSKADIKKNLSL